MDTTICMQGNLVGEPVQKAVANGAKVTRFRMAASGRRFDQSTNDWVSTDPVFMNVSCWRQLADNVVQSLHKGDTVIVLGRLRFREYDDPKDGSRRQAYEIEALSVGPDLTRYVTPLQRPLRELPAIPEQSKDKDEVQESAA